MGSHKSEGLKCYPCVIKNRECFCASLGICSCSQTLGLEFLFTDSLPSCVFYSPRIQDLYEGERMESETTQDHWTIVDPKSAKRVGKANRRYFNKVLMNHPVCGAFFREFQDLKVGKKIGEGGQAEIFEATTQRDTDLVAKVFKKDVSLKDLERQWPPQMISAVVSKDCDHSFSKVLGGALLRDGEYKDRFAFVMCRRWGDLRSLIDQRMLKLLQNKDHGPPFCNMRVVCSLIYGLLLELISIHEAGLVHRDIKASNVLIDGIEGSSLSFPNLMDFECSLGTLGTGFWRAPEILEQVQRRVPSHEVVYTKEADIYSFGMLCYEILTGLMPFEGQPQNDYSGVLRGERPRLPDDFNLDLRELILSCWQHNPQDRPSAQKILNKHRFLYLFSIDNILFIDNTLKLGRSP